jgi:hypothetical protein
MDVDERWFAEVPKDDRMMTQLVEGDAGGRSRCVPTIPASAVSALGGSGGGQLTAATPVLTASRPLFLAL